MYGNGATGATSSSHCTNCGAGKYSSSTAKSSACTDSCAAGKYGTGGSTSSSCTGSCSAGKWGSTGQSSSSCNGDCDAGYYCTSGSTSATQNECGGNDYYCPAGSTAPTAVPAGCFSIGGSSPETRTGKYLNEGGVFIKILIYFFNLKQHCHTHESSRKTKIYHIHEWSTVVDISIAPHSLKLVSLSLSRSPLSKTPKQVFFNPINIFDSFTQVSKLVPPVSTPRMELASTVPSADTGTRLLRSEQPVLETVLLDTFARGELVLRLSLHAA